METVVIIQAYRSINTKPNRPSNYSSQLNAFHGRKIQLFPSEHTYPAPTLMSLQSFSQSKPFINNYCSTCLLQKSPRKLSNSSVQALPENRRHLMDLDEGELFMELIRDVANELDIDVLCHKILVNVGLLTHADRGSLFLAKGTPTNRYLVAKLFDVTQKTGERRQM